jgi:hypothetical protein
MKAHRVLLSFTKQASRTKVLALGAVLFVAAFAACSASSSDDSQNDALSGGFDSLPWKTNLNKQ